MAASHTRAQRVLVVGVGNEWRSDDGVGRYVAQRLAGMLPRDVSVRVESGEGAALMEAWGGFDRVILIDATRSGSPAGAACRFDARESPLPTGFFHYSTHEFSLAEAVELARMLGRLPHSLVVYGIEGESFAAGRAISPPVQRAADDLVLRLRDDLAGSGHAD